MQTAAAQAFDELLLMKRGGRIIFFGETGHYSQKLVDYFEVRRLFSYDWCTDTHLLNVRLSSGIYQQYGRLAC